MDLIEERARRGGEPNEAAQPAAHELTALHAELTSQANEKNDDALQRVRERLAASTADLKHTHQLEKELDQELE